MPPLTHELSEASSGGAACFSLPVSAKVAKELLRGRARPPRLQALKNEPGRFSDLVGLGFSWLHAVSPAFIAATEGLSGLAFLPIELEGGPEDYRLLTVTGECSPVDYSKALELERTITGGMTFLRLRGLPVDDPEGPVDFAVPPNRDSIFMTARAAAALFDANLDNVRLDPISEVTYYIADEMINLASSRDIAQR